MPVFPRWYGIWVSPQAALGILRLMLEGKQCLVAGILTMYPHHATLDLFSIDIEASSVYSSDDPPVAIAVLLLYVDLLAEDQIREALLGVLSVSLGFLRGIDLNQAHLNLALLWREQHECIGVRDTYNRPLVGLSIYQTPEAKENRSKKQTDPLNEVLGQFFVFRYGPN
jgi:hypothetical protein